MTLADYGSVAEIIGVFGMIGSLLYVGYQLQQTRVQMKGNAAQARLDSLMNLWLTTTNLDYAEADTRAVNAPGIDDLAQIDSRQINGFMVSWFGFLQNTFYQRKIGLLDDEQVGYLNKLPYFRQGYVREYWEQHKSFGTYPEDFVAHIDRIISLQDAEATK